jgi:hypothetical protein
LKNAPRIVRAGCAAVKHHELDHRLHYSTL